MNEELLQQAIKLFDTQEKWSSFVELIKRNEEIQNRWWKKLQQEVYQRELRDLGLDWSIYIWNNWDIMWYIKGESNKSLAIHFWRDTLRVFYNYGDLDINKVNELIKEPRFDIIKSNFDRIDGTNNETIGWENKNFFFGSAHDGRFADSRILSWYAGNMTTEFADQLIQKVRRFQTEEITLLFKEINEKCKRNKSSKVDLIL